jgi:hypothetical protein
VAERGPFWGFLSRAMICLSSILDGAYVCSLRISTVVWLSSPSPANTLPCLRWASVLALELTLLVLPPSLRQKLDSSGPCTRLTFLQGPLTLFVLFTFFRCRIAYTLDAGTRGHSPTLTRMGLAGRQLPV